MGPFDVYLLLSLSRRAGTPSEFNIQCANREKPSSPSNHKNSSGQFTYQDIVTQNKTMKHTETI